MELFVNGLAWLADPANWSGPQGIPTRTLEHVLFSGAAVAVALLVALPVGLLIGHTGRAAVVTVGVANLGRAVPSYALLFVFFPVFGFALGGFATPFPALVLLAIPPILTNAYVGVRDVDREMIEAGRGMGMSEWQILRGVELPLALPAIVAGIRIASVQVVATATLAALVAAGGLGRFIVDGFARRGATGFAMLVGGAILVALLALATERAMTLVERHAVSRGLTVDNRTHPAPRSAQAGGT